MAKCDCDFLTRVQFFAYLKISYIQYIIKDEDKLTEQLVKTIRKYGAKNMEPIFEYVGKVSRIIKPNSIYCSRTPNSLFTQ